MNTNRRLDPTDVERLTRFVTQMREDSVQSVLAWMDDAERRGGGKLLLKAPTRTNGEGHLPEAAFQSASWEQLRGN